MIRILAILTSNHNRTYQPSALTLLLLLGGLLAGCRSTGPVLVATAVPPTAVIPTPEVGVTFVTLAPPTVAVLQITPTPLPTATPTPTATPIIYNIVEGDTLLGIAIRKLTTVEQILALNPGVTPELLQINQPIVLPPPATPILGEGGSTVVPATIVVNSVSTYRTPLGGLWVLGELKNAGALAVENVQVAITLRDPAGEPVYVASSWAVPAVIAAGAAAPFGLLIANPPDELAGTPADPLIAVSSAVTVVDLGTRSIDLALTIRSASFSDADGLLAVEVRNEGALALVRTYVVVTLFDSQGRVSGYRQVELTDPLPAGAATTIDVAVAPPGAPPVRAVLSGFGVIG